MVVLIRGRNVPRGAATAAAIKAAVRHGGECRTRAGSWAAGY